MTPKVDPKLRAWFDAYAAKKEAERILKALEKDAMKALKKCPDAQLELEEGKLKWAKGKNKRLDMKRGEKLLDAKTFKALLRTKSYEFIRVTFRRKKNEAT